MNNKIMKNKIITIIFILFLSSIFVLNLLSPIKDISFSERRPLEDFPELSIDNILSRDFMKRFEKYALDQFVFRDTFRSIKAFIAYNVFNKSDNNDIYVLGDNVFKIEYPLNINSINNMSNYLNKIYDMYLKDCNVFFSIIPDKNYFSAKENGYLSIDYDKLEEIMLENIKNMNYIDIFDSLNLSDYYRTDPHWKQEKLDEVIKKISSEMNYVTDINNIHYDIKNYYPFYGAYYGQSALNIKPDELKYKISEDIKNAIVRNYEYSGNKDDAPGIYDEKKLGEMDSYDVFLSGSTPLTTIENPNSKTDKELIIFRDSFGSSLAPLLIEEYSKITLIDLRYVSHTIIGDFVDFDNQDVLFIYSTLVINNSNILK